MSRRPNFDRVATLYRWAEYLSLGPLLERTREHFLPQLLGSRHALVLGDGDGRFTARLLATNASVRVHAVDLSRRMLALLQQRAQRTTSLETQPRLHITQGDALAFLPDQQTDLVVTHFFLDCLDNTEVERLVNALVPRLAPCALWLVSEFRIPNGALHWPARAYVRLLYTAFAVLTGLRIRKLPDYAATLRRAGFVPVATHLRLFGLLSSELWQLQRDRS